MDRKYNWVWKWCGQALIDIIDTGLKFMCIVMGREFINNEWESTTLKTDINSMSREDDIQNEICLFGITC
jgi:hypothetical protein